MKIPLKSVLREMRRRGISFDKIDMRGVKYYDRKGRPIKKDEAAILGAFVKPGMDWCSWAFSQLEGRLGEFDRGIREVKKLDPEAGMALKKAEERIFDAIENCKDVIKKMSPYGVKKYK